jgi:sugar phosphate isomerase/epimerase
MPISRRDFFKTGAAASLITGATPKINAATSVKPGLKSSLAAYSFRNVLPNNGKPGKIDLHALFDFAAKEYGLSAIEPTSYYFSSEDTAYLYSMRAHAHKLGLDISGTAIRNDFCHIREKVRKDSIAHVKRWVDHSVKIGAPAIRIFAGNNHAKVDEQQARDWAVECMKECCDYAGENGIYLALENHGYLTGTSVELIDFLDRVKHEWLGINLDSGNFTKDPYGNIERITPYAVNVQLKTEVIAENGKGREEADIQRIVNILNTGGYRGYIALEYEGGPDPYKAVPKYLTQLNTAIENLS